MAVTGTPPRVTAIAPKLFMREGGVAPFSQWQARFSCAASGFPGFLSIDLLLLTARVAEWRVVQQFRSAGEMALWVASKERQELLDETAALRDGPYRDDRWCCSFCMPPGSRFLGVFCNREKEKDS